MSKKAGRKSLKDKRSRKAGRRSRRAGLKRGGLSRRVKRGGDMANYLSTFNPPGITHPLHW
jgi:hypothetical protein